MSGQAGFKILLCVLLALSGCSSHVDRPGQRTLLSSSAVRQIAPPDPRIRLDPILSVEQAHNAKLHIDTLTTAAQVRVRSPDMAAGDTLKVYWPGATAQSTAIQTATGSTPLLFDLPVAWLRANVGRTVGLYYTYKIGGAGESIRSLPLPIEVIDSSLVFSVDGVVQDRLNISAVGSAATVRVRSPGMAAGDTLKIYWAGTPSHATAIQTATSSTPLSFQIPKAWLLESLNTSVRLYYTYKIAGVGETIRSEEIRITMSSEDVEHGYLLAHTLNTRYNDTRNNCDGQAAFYCNGVLARITGGTDRYRAWNPSPGAITRGGISFSYLRRDLNLPRLAWLKERGIIFEAYRSSPSQGGVDIPVLCSFPNDGATSNRPSQGGCGPSRSYPVDSRPCAEQSIDTVDKWVAHYRAGGSPGSVQAYNHQCALGPDPSAFAISLAARAHLVPAENKHNELMLRTWAMDIPRQLPIEAIFYMAGEGQLGGLAEAQYIQQDYYERVQDDGGQAVVLPIVKFNLAPEASATAFSYSAQDQIRDSTSVLQRPSVKQAVATILQPVDARDALTVVVARQALLIPNDDLVVNWTGPAGTPAAASFTSPSRKVSQGLEVGIPKTVVAFALNKTARVTYSISRGGTTQVSTPLNLDIQPLPPTSLTELVIEQAADNGAGPGLDTSELTGNGSIRMGTWPLMASGQPIWLEAQGTKRDGSAYIKQIKQPPTSITNTTWMNQGYWPAAIAKAELQGLRDGSRLTLIFKAGLGGSEVENDAVTFASRVYTVHTQPRSLLAP